MKLKIYHNFELISVIVVIFAAHAATVIKILNAEIDPFTSFFSSIFFSRLFFALYSQLCNATWYNFGYENSLSGSIFSMPYDHD